MFYSIHMNYLILVSKLWTLLHEITIITLLFRTFTEDHYFVHSNFTFEKTYLKNINFPYKIKYYGEYK